MTDDRAALESAIASLLDSHRTMTLATAGAGGPWAATVYYCREGWDLYWFSSPGARHSTDIETAPGVAASIQRDDQPWCEIQGLQIEGEAALAGPALGRPVLLARMAAKYSFLKDAANAPGDIARALAKVSFYRLAPRRIRLIDNASGFGRNRELRLEKRDAPI